MAYKLMDNGNILHNRGIYDAETHLHTTRPDEITPDTDDYRLSIPMLPNEQKPRAREVYLAKHPGTENLFGMTGRPAEP